MNFNPVAGERKAQRLFPKGDYEFLILEAEEKQSAAGNLMIALSIEVSDARGNKTTVKDYLVAKRAAKIRRAAYACGLGDRFNTGSMRDSDFIERRGRLRLGIEKDKTGEYPDKNIVVDYLAATAKKSLPAPKLLEAPRLDEILARYGK
jgi:hypothetical protein